MPKMFLSPLLLLLSTCSLGSLGGGVDTPAPKPPSESETPETKPEHPDSSWETSSFLDKIKGKYLITQSTPPILFATVQDDGALYLNVHRVRRYMQTQKSPSNSTYSTTRRPEYTHWFGASLEIDGLLTNFIWLSEGSSLDSWTEESYVNFDYKNMHAGISYHIYRISDTKP